MLYTLQTYNYICQLFLRRFKKKKKNEINSQIKHLILISHKSFISCDR